MSITPKGMSLQEAYRNYTTDKFLVNRKYQRKLVWTVDEKEYLIDSINRGFPIPLILLAQTPEGKLEIIDGLQRLNAIVSFIENRFALSGKFFDVNQSARAKQLAEEGIFPYHTDNLLDPKECANILDYQLAVTIYPSSGENEITDIFGRINSGGKQLSPQEKRQAGMIDNFSDTVRKLASEIRGDSSQDLVSLSKMPEISIDSTREDIGYGLKADEIFWCSQGVLWKAQLRDSEDEEMIADIVASIIYDEPFARSKELFDKVYEPSDEQHIKMNAQLSLYGIERVVHEVKVVFSILEKIFDDENCTIREVVNPKSSNPVKASFYALFMAVFHLVVKEEKSPDQTDKIIKAIAGLQKDMISTAKYSTTEDRTKNVHKTTGLIQSYFIKKDPPVLKHGAGLSIDFENSIRRSKVETNRYECKQGFIDLSSKREINEDLFDRLIETICGIANVGPEADGYLFIGVADKKADADRINELDKITPAVINQRYIVGIDRELKIMGCDMDGYINKSMSKIAKSDLSDPLKTQVLSQLDVIDYKTHSVLRLRIPKQTQLSFVGDKSFTRENSKTIELKGPKLLAVSALFKP
ncbi:DUF262 domain-containing protein [Hymenobacter ginsengisoli]|uniref:DUF262 domain-containing protein n=1 Tax=Hymenobacter ginsengisoli TaxID=1051626 RepID=A0ABP8QLA4_9BACT|nr:MULTISPECIES: DUF262 domain-containing protein [unclassified Hymenobacter]MBO2031105.1 DUF262 domain-containing protein [Hymenobacter sp. BT559]